MRIYEYEGGNYSIRESTRVIRAVMGGCEEVLEVEEEEEHKSAKTDSEDNHHRGLYIADMRSRILSKRKRGLRVQKGWTWKNEETKRIIGRKNKQQKMMRGQSFSPVTQKDA